MELKAASRFVLKAGRLFYVNGTADHTEERNPGGSLNDSFFDGSWRRVLKK